MDIKKWTLDLAEALPRASAGEVPRVRVMCERVTVEEVQKFLTEMGASVQGGHAGGRNSSRNEAVVRDELPLRISLLPIRGEDYDFVCDDGVEVIASPYDSLLAVYSRIDDVPGGLLRAALTGFLEGRPIPAVATYLDGLIERGLEDGEASPYASAEHGGVSLFLGRLPPAKA
jgi:hypothetical protein